MMYQTKSKSPATYISKDNIVTAVQWNKVGDHPQVRQVGEALKIDPPYQYYLDTPHRAQIVEPGDWIVEFSDSNSFVIRPESFENHYKPLYPQVKTDVSDEEITKLVARLGVKQCYLAPSDIELARNILLGLIRDDEGNDNEHESR